MIFARVDLASGSSTLFIPKGAKSLVGFQVATPVATRQQGCLSTVLNDTFSKAIGGTSKGVIAFSRDTFWRPGEFPVLEGEALLVSVETTGTAVLYFDDLVDP